MRLTSLKVALLSLTLVSCSGIRIDRDFTPSSYDWVHFGGAPSRANVAEANAGPPFMVAWQYNALAGIAATPLVRDSVVIIATLHSELQAVHIGTGKRLGYTVLESAIRGTPALADAVAFVTVAGSTETLAAIDLRTSKRLWTANPGPIESSPLLVNNAVYVTTLSGDVHAFNKDTGERLWLFGVAGHHKPIRSSPASDGKLVFFGGDDGWVRAVDRVQGTLRWSHETKSSIFASPIVAGTRVLVGLLNGNLVCLDTKSGALVWRFDTGAPIYGTAAANESTVFIGSSNGILHALDLESGTLRWTFSAGSVINSAPLITDRHVYVGSLDRTVYALDIETGAEIWKHTALGRVKVSPVLWGTTLLVTSEDKYVQALRPSP
jgi:outer membrane protein assembly factor BamB